MIIWILLLGLILRLISLNQSFWLDEATSVLVARDFSITEIVTRFSPGDFHPPLYYIMLLGWIKLFGSSEVAVRMMSVLFGIATIWLVYRITKIIFNFQFSIFNYLPALLLATAPLHIYYSQETRMYVPATFLTTIVVYFVAKFITSKKPNLQQFVWLTLSSAALLYTDYLPIFFLASIFIFLLIYKRQYFKFLLGWVFGTALLFVPWIPTFSMQFQSGLLVKQNAPLWWATLGKTNLKEVLLVPVKFIIGRISSYDKIFYASSVAIASLPFIFSLFNSLLQFSKMKLLWFWFLMPLILAAFFGIFLSGFSYFRLIFVLPAFYLLAAHGALSFKNSTLKKAVVGGFVLVNLTATSIYLFNPRFHREDWRSAVSYIEENSKGNAAAIFVSKNQADPYRYYSKTVPYYGSEGVELGFEKVWLMRYVQPIFDPQDTLRQKIEKEGYYKVDERDFNGVVVWEYGK